MEKLAEYRQIIKDILIPYIQIPYSHGDMLCQPVFDETHDSYLLMTIGWDDKTRVHGCLIHLDIIDGKIWVQRDETEDGVTYELVDAGIPKDCIVLGVSSRQRSAAYRLRCSLIAPTHRTTAPPN